MYVRVCICIYIYIDICVKIPWPIPMIFSKMVGSATCLLLRSWCFAETLPKLSGASTGVYEALELRDKDTTRPVRILLKKCKLSKHFPIYIYIYTSIYIYISRLSLYIYIDRKMYTYFLVWDWGTPEKTGWVSIFPRKNDPLERPIRHFQPGIIWVKSNGLV